MVKSRTDDESHLQEPLLPERLASFSFQPSRSPPAQQHTLDLDLDSGSVDGIPADTSQNQGGNPDNPRLERQSSFFGSLSDRWKLNLSQNGYEGLQAGKDADRDRVRRAQNKRRLRNPIQKKSFVRRAAHTAAHEPVYFLKNLIWGIVLWPKWAWDAIRSQKTLTVLSLKAGVAAGLASVICVLSLPDPYDELSVMAIWAIVTIDLLSESNIGLSLSKGVNRVAGTFSAGALAVILTQLGPDVPASIYPYYVVFWVTFGGFVFRFLKGIPPLKDQWGYAFTVATLSFHILLISTYQEPENLMLPLMRFLMILFGFFLSSIINVAFQPVYAGDSLHKLVAKNFDTAADVLSRCVKEYSNSTMLDHVPDILCGRSEDDKIHQSYHEVVMSDSDVDKLLGAVTWEPCHGRFFRGYPWHLYDDITDYLRYTLYDVIALDSCLRASIQAPKFLRDIFSEEMNVIAEECGKVLHTLADSMRNMKKFSSEDILCRAEEAALALQNNIYIHTHLLLGRGAMESPRYPFYVASSHADGDPWTVAGTRMPVLDNMGRDEDQSKVGSHDVPDNTSEQSAHSYKSVKHFRFSSEDNDEKGHPSWHDFDQLEAIIGRNAAQEECSCATREIEQTSNFSPRQPGQEQDQTSVDIDNHCPKHGTSVETGRHDSPVPNLRVQTGDSELGQQDGNSNVGSKPSGLQAAGWKQNFMQRRSSLGHNWEGTLERISALSLVKFASLLIEVVAKMKFVVNSVDELSQAARFQEISTEEEEDTD
ncbi:unnamed protein product [Calypogeia fissa]